MIHIDPNNAYRLNLLFKFLDEVGPAVPLEMDGEETIVEAGPPPMSEEARIAARRGVDRIMAKLRNEANHGI